MAHSRAVGVLSTGGSRVTQSRAVGVLYVLEAVG